MWVTKHVTKIIRDWMWEMLHGFLATPFWRFLRLVKYYNSSRCYKMGLKYCNVFDILLELEETHCQNHPVFNVTVIFDTKVLGDWPSFHRDFHQEHLRQQAVIVQNAEEDRLGHSSMLAKRQCRSTKITGTWTVVLSFLYIYLYYWQWYF